MIRQVVLGATINLMNYENIKLEVTADSFREAAAALDEVLFQLEIQSDGPRRSQFSRYRSEILAPIVADPDEPAPEKEPETPAPDPVPEQTVPPDGKHIALPTAGPGDVACRSCGKAITANERKVSQLLTENDFCQACLNRKTVKP